MLRRLSHDEQGVALVLALIAMLVIGALSASILTATAVNHRSAKVSADANHAFTLAENGLAYAEGRLYSAPTSAEAALVPISTLPASTDDPGATISYHGTLCDGTTTPSCSPKVWTLYGTGTYNGVTRTVSVRVTVPTVTTTVASTSTTTSTSTDTTIWNYIYVNSTGSCTTLSGGLTINVPIYLHGSLCLTGGTVFTGSDLEVGGNLSISGGNTRIGSSSQPISKMNVVGNCSPGTNAVYCDGAHSPIWVNAPGVGNTLTPIVTMPTIDLAGKYATTNPGPASGHDCPAGSNVPSPFFDTDHTLNNSLGNANLFPAGHPYDCAVGGSEIKWDGSTNLTLSGGPFVFDGSFSISSNTAIRYSGSGVIYFTGGVTILGNSKLCGVTGSTVSGSNVTCNGLWTPDTNGLILAVGCWANSTGSTLLTNGCVKLSAGSFLQAGTILNGDYQAAGGSSNLGPVITNTGSFSGNLAQMLPIHNLPIGAPANTTTTTSTTTNMTTTTIDGTPQAPTGWNG